MNIAVSILIALAIPPELPGLDDAELDPRLMGLVDVEPAEAVALAVEAEEVPELLEEMLRVCKRESHCSPTGIHPKDASAGRKAYKAAVRKGWLHPDECREHRPKGSWAMFSTVGIMGVRGAWALHLLEEEFGACPSPDLLLHPGPAALAAVRWAKECKVLTERVDDQGRVRRRKVPGCGCSDRARMWAGPGRFDSWTNRRRRESLTRQCGEQPELTTWEVLADIPLDLQAAAMSVWEWIVAIPDRQEQTTA